MKLHPGLMHPHSVGTAPHSVGTSPHSVGTNRKMMIWLRKPPHRVMAKMAKKCTKLMQHSPPWYSLGPRPHSVGTTPHGVGTQQKTWPRCFGGPFRRNRRLSEWASPMNGSARLIHCSAEPSG